MPLLRGKEYGHPHSRIIVSRHSVAILYCISIIISKLAKAGNVSPLQLIDALRTMCEK